MSIFADIAPQACWELLAADHFARIGVVIDGQPIVVPINYRLAEWGGRPIVVIRTIPNSLVARHPGPVCLEIDGRDEIRSCGWSVLVKGRLLDSDDIVDCDPLSWAPGAQHWMVIDPIEITGRSLVGAEQLWPFSPHAYI